jgi:hypothetical protein
MRAWWEVAVAAALLAGCAGSDSGNTKAGAHSPDGGGVDAGMMPTHPPKDAGTSRPDGAHRVEAGPPACGATGAVCTANEDCCSSEGIVCQGFGMCCAPGRAGSQVICSGDSDCCSGHCGTSADGVQRACCSKTSGPCYDDFDCCYGLACNAGINLGAPTCCAPTGSKCSPDIGCCPGTVCGFGCEPLGGGGCAVTPNLCCIPPGHACLTDSDCCKPESGNQGSLCYGEVCCFSIGGACTSGDQCCANSCTDGLCD